MCSYQYRNSDQIHPPGLFSESTSPSRSLTFCTRLRDSICPIFPRLLNPSLQLQGNLSGSCLATFQKKSCFSTALCDLCQHQVLLVKTLHVPTHIARILGGHGDQMWTIFNKLHVKMADCDRLRCEESEVIGGWMVNFLPRWIKQII